MTKKLKKKYNTSRYAYLYFLLDFNIIVFII